ncbi:MAG: hypothetical protein U0S36_13370 [Candidatus Nanopelagicales bacterium]
MGLLSDLRTLSRQAEEIRAGYDPVAQAHAGIASMRAAREAMQAAASVAASTAAATGCATVLRVCDTGLSVGDLPVADVDLLVDVDGRPPFPAQVRTGIRWPAPRRRSPARSWPCGSRAARWPCSGVPP